MSYWTDVLNSSKTGRSTKNTGTGGADARRNIAATYNSRQINDTPDRPYVSAGPLGTADQAERWINTDTVGGGPTPPPYSPSGSSGRRGGGGYGGYGGGLAAQAAQRAALQALLKSKLLAAADFTKDRTRVKNAVSADRAKMDETYNALLGRVQKTATPYDYKVAAAGKVDPDMSALLAAQGFDPTAYQADVANVNAASDQAAAGFTNMRDALNAAFAESLASRAQQVREQQAFGGTQLSAEERGLMQLIDEKARQDKKEKDAMRMQLIMQLIGAGEKMDVNAINALLGG